MSELHLGNNQVYKINETEVNDAKISDFKVENDNDIFISYNNTTHKHGDLYLFDYKNKKNTKLTNLASGDNIDCVDITNEYIYFGCNNNSKIYRVDKDGKNYKTWDLPNKSDTAGVLSVTHLKNDIYFIAKGNKNNGWLYKLSNDEISLIKEIKYYNLDLGDKNSLTSDYKYVYYAYTGGSGWSTQTYIGVFDGNEVKEYQVNDMYGWIKTQN